MSEKEQIDAFAESLDKLISKFIREFDLTVASAVGVLELAKAQCIKSALENNEDE